MEVISPHDILAVSYQDIWNVFNKGEYVIKYDDGSMEETNYKTIVFNRYIWIPFEYYNAPIVKEYSVNSIITKQYFTAEVHIKLLEAIFKGICETCHLDTFDKKEDLLKIVYRVYNLLYVDYVNKISSYVTTIDATDFIEVVKFEEIRNAHSNLKPYPESIEQTYRDVKRLLNTTDHKDNMFVHAYKSKSINENQANQCIGPRGFVADIDRTVFKQPIMSGFITGMSTVFDLAAESRTAAKALNASDKHIAMSEYNSRLMQILTMTVRNVEYTDCGSTDYFDFLIQPNTINTLKGKYYLSQDTNTLKVITGNEKELENTIVKLRTALGCRLPDQHSLCSTCLGDISKNFKSNSNLGYTFTSFLMEKSSQSILSTKHLTHSVKANEIKLEGEALTFFSPKDDLLYLSKNIDLTCTSIVLDSKQVPKLMDVLNLSHSHISLEKLGEIKAVVFLTDKHEKKISTTVNVQYGDRQSILTKEFLDYIRSINIFSDNKGNYIVPLQSYNIKNPIFSMPLKENNIINFVIKLASMVETNVDKVKDPYDKLDMIYSHIMKQFSINLSILEVIVYATTVYNQQQDDYSLGRNSATATTENMSMLNRFRSLSALFSTNDQENAIFKSNLATFYNNRRINHEMDVFFDPVNVLNSRH